MSYQRLNPPSVLPIVNGGTGASTADGACANIGAVKLDSRSQAITLRYYVTQSNQKRIYIYNENGAQLGIIYCDE